MDSIWEEPMDSIWTATTDGNEFPSLEEDLNVDVLVVGAGIAGMCTAWRLARTDQRVAIIDAARVCEGVTANTTAKVTAGHSLIYEKLTSKIGSEYAQAYADANLWGIEWIADQAAKHDIACDLRRNSMLVFAENADEREHLHEEFEAAKKLKLPVAWSEETDLPLKTMGAIRYENQAQFHPRKFVQGLAARIDAQVFEKTRALDLEEKDGVCTVTTNRGKITAKYVVIASHFPFYDPGMFYARLSQFRDYAVAARIRGQIPKSMSIGAAQSAKAFRTQPFKNEELLIVSGEGHNVGEEPDTRTRYENLERYVRQNFDVEEIVFRWSTQDNNTLDSMPYIGQASSGSDRVFVITGFGGWGMAAGAYSGRIISDLIAGRANPWAEFFAPGRFKGAESLKNLASQGVTVAKHYVGDKMSDVSDKPPGQLKPGEAAIVKVDGEKVAAYRDNSGVLHAVSPVCTHMGCDLAWNTAEESWDCPCHGSRFDPNGMVLHGPAVNHLEIKTVANKSHPELL
jgi:glycine/D-amino acid oxidase-like deaminating enzyme/nitrite reductase/ring-hydroxylating ferredoxin subunit